MFVSPEEGAPDSAGRRMTEQNPGMTIELIPLCTATVTLKDPIMIPESPAGMRVIVEVESWDVEGERLNAHLHGAAAADWMTISSALLGTIDVRATLETDDGALIYTWYHGRMDLSGGTGSSPAYSAPLYETSDERYAWMNKIQAVAKGTTSPDGHRLVYEICEVR
jgi:Protein of unknown function (DUF3237)